MLKKTTAQAVSIAAAIVLAVIITTGSSLFAAGKQMQFNSPKDAFKAVVEASKTNDTARLLNIFGPGGKEIISSGDAVADTNARERFVRSAEESVTFRNIDKNTVLAMTGKNTCSFPIPIVKAGNKWVFSTEEGKQEILNRRIGRNELDTINVVQAYVEAQREYMSKVHDSSGVQQYAQRFVSRSGSRDGLYWAAQPGEEISPLGPLFVKATEEGYTIRKQGEKHRPYHGYFFKILKSQGSHAPGGAKDYIENGSMTVGFGLIAYPAEYGISGIMTFIVNQDGVVYEKDLGPKSGETAALLTKYDPDPSWKKVK